MQFGRSFFGSILLGAAMMSVLGPDSSLLADEGMWLFNRLPVERLAERYGFRPEPGWAEHVMRSAVRLSSGGSGSFVSADGLVLTNHHVASDCLQKLSTAERNLMEEGFLARSRAEELRCPDLEILVLWEIEDVTSRVQAAVKPDMEPGAAEQARRAARAAIEQESKEKTGLHSEVVTLYRGGEDHLYRYRRYDDVRLVMAPEVDIAFFGGDPDNFEFPRFCLDVCFLRVYEGGKPARVEHHLRWNQSGLEEGELIFVAGNPGSTQRLNTVDHLRFLRDVGYPRLLDVLYRREIALQQFSLEGAEEARIARDDLFGIQNSRKAVRGILAGLLDPAILAGKQRFEAELKGRVAADPSLGASLEDWSRIAASLEANRAIYDEYMLLERGRAFWSELFGKARTLVRLAEERAKPSAERLPEYRDAALPSLELELYSPAPIHPELEIAKLTDSLTAAAGTLGAEHPLASVLLGGRSPEARARELVRGTGLASVERRRELASGGAEALAGAHDPMVALARSVDPHARAVRRKYEDWVQSVQRQAYAGISRAAFAVTGTATYPDATFTPRLAFGAVKGWEEDGERISPFTRLGGAYELNERHEGKEPYRLPPSWLAPAARQALDLSTPFNFASTADIIGGNSGSPVINRKAELVGIIFDGNIHSLVLDIAYTEERARAISVSGQVVVETLEKVYGMGWLVRELLGR
jgi:hypothetical protein